MAALTKHVAETPGVAHDDVDAWELGGQPLREAWIELDGEVMTSPAQAMLDGPGEGARTWRSAAGRGERPAGGERSSGTVANVGFGPSVVSEIRDA